MLSVLRQMAFPVCIIIIAADTVLVQLEATVPVVTVHSYRLC